MCSAITADAAPAEHLYHELIQVIEEIVRGYGVIDPLPLERLVRHRFGISPEDRLDIEAVRGLVHSFSSKIEWRDAAERDHFLSVNLDALVLMADPVRAIAAGLPPLRQSDIDKLTDTIDKLELNETQRDEILANINSRAQPRDIRGALGAIWRWLCVSTGDGCSKDSSGGSVGGPGG